MLGKIVIDELRGELLAGATQGQVAMRHGLTRGYLNMLICGRRKPGGLTLDKFDRMFPSAVVHLHGEPPPAVAQTAHHVRTISQSVGGDAGRLDAVRAIVGCATLTDAEKIKALRPLLGME